MDKTYYTAKEVAEIYGVCKSSAYKIIKTLNEKLEMKGYLTVCGKVNKKWLDQNFYGGVPTQDTDEVRA